FQAANPLLNQTYVFYNYSEGKLSMMRRTNLTKPALVELPAPGCVACVWLPSFAVWAERARRTDLPMGPLVLTGRLETGEAVVVRACSPEAAAAGLLPGMPAHSIPQRCPGAMILPFDARCYEGWYDALLEALDAVTPQIEAQPLEVFYLDLSGLPHLDPEDPEAVQEAVRAAIPSPFRPR